MENLEQEVEVKVEEDASVMNEDELFKFVDENPDAAEKITAPRYSYWKSVLRVFFKKKSNWVVIGIFIFILLMTYGYALFLPPTYMDIRYNPYITNGLAKNLTPIRALEVFGTPNYILGTGKYGEPLFDHIWKGSQISLSLAFICAIINMTVGVIVGAIWGFSKKVDIVMTEIYNIIANVPYILFIAVFVMVVGAGFWSFVAALTVTGWLGIAYFIRTQVLIIRDREYNLASKCLGTRTFKLTIKNILPFMTSVIVTILATEVPSYISYEVFLSYLGIGLSASTPSLGRLIQQGQASMNIYPFQFWSPVFVAALITIILYIVGQNLADASDPRTHM